MKKQKELNAALYSAVCAQDMVKTRLLLEEGADPDCTHQLIFKRLDYSCWPMLQIAMEKDNADLVRLLAEYGADMNRRCPMDSSDHPIYRNPLCRALLQGKVDMALLLFDLGADPAAKDPNGNDAFDYAEDMRRYDLVDIFKAGRQARFAAKQAEIDDIIFSRPLGDRVLEEHYDFRTFERVTMIRRPADNVVESFCREEFVRIGEGQLRTAFNEHMKRGGKSDEALVFGKTVLNKEIGSAI